MRINVGNRELKEVFECHVHNFQSLTVPEEFHENDAHGIKKLLLKTQISEKFLHSEVNLIIQYIIVQDQDGQNNNNLKK